METVKQTGLLFVNGRSLQPLFCLQGDFPVSNGVLPLEADLSSSLLSPLNMVVPTENLSGRRSKFVIKHKIGNKHAWLVWLILLDRLRPVSRYHLERQKYVYTAFHVQAYSFCVFGCMCVYFPFYVMGIWFKPFLVEIWYCNASLFPLLEKMCP